MTAWRALPLMLLLAACAHSPQRADVGRPVSRPGSAASPAPATAGIPEACRQTREHRDEDYTAGGLYAPGVSDSAPTAALDVSGLVEPEPRDEPRSAYGNRSPYKVLGRNYHVREHAEGYRERGIASWYGQKFHGRLTSSREVYDMCAFSAAHKTLPLPSYVRVRNLDNGRSVVVRVNDRGPFHEGRIIDLSYAAAIRIGLDRTGTARVEVEALAADDGDSTRYARDLPPPPRPLPMPASPRMPAPLADGLAAQVLQVGSYGEQANADRAAQRLQDAGIADVSVDPVEVNGRRLWRVRIGPLAAAAAQALVEQVRALGFAGPRLFPL